MLRSFGLWTPCWEMRMFAPLFELVMKSVVVTTGQPLLPTVISGIDIFYKIINCFFLFLN
jgi:hypothetical protein